MEYREMDTTNIVFLAFQVGILLVQVFIAVRSARNSQSFMRGLFVINHRGDGIIIPRFEKNYYRFDDDIYRYIVFLPLREDIILLNLRIILNGNDQIVSNVETDNVFLVDEPDGGLRVNLPLKQADLDSGVINCKVIFRLKTLSNLEYFEEVQLKFIKETNDSVYWRLIKYLPQLTRN